MPLLSIPRPAISLTCDLPAPTVGIPTQISARISKTILVLTTVSVEELTPIEIRIKKLVEDFFSNRITDHQFKLELTRMREEFEPDGEQKTSRNSLKLREVGRSPQLYYFLGSKVSGRQ
jgi:hypothetical protein